MRRKSACCAILSVAAALLGASVAAAAPPGVGLDEGCYLRWYCRFGRNRYSPAALKAEGEKVLGKTGMERLKRDTERLMASGKVGAPTGDWWECVYQPMHQNFSPPPAPLPGDDWASPDFDDGAWVLHRGPFQGAPPADITSPNLGQFSETMDLGLQAAFHRARFLLDDPEQAGTLTFRMTYAGGARALINGQEIARGHLPQGPLGAEAAGEDYPLQAYKPGAEGLSERTLGPIKVPAKLLRKGVNVLAVEVRASNFHPIVLTNPRQANWGGPTRPWPHGRLLKLELRSSSPGVRSAGARPPGVQVWACDVHHRTESGDFLPPGEAPGTARLVGPRDGTCSAQIAIGTDRPLADLQAVAGEFKQVEGSARLPAGAFQVLHGLPYPLEEWCLKRLGDERGLGASFPDAAKLAAYAKMTNPTKACIFDQLTTTPPALIPANTTRPVWLSARIPSDAAPGAYRGTVTVSAQGMASVAIPVEVRVVDFRLPEAKDFQTFVGCEENPYGVARQYGVKPWSEEHFKLLDSSFRQLGRVGNKWVNVPVLANTEFGNKDDSMIRWSRKDRGFSFDYTILDRYLDLAARHCGPPRAVQFVVMQGMKSQTQPPSPPVVKVFDAGGRGSLLPMSATAGPEQRDAWKAFATSAYEHMKARGQEKVMYWGAPLEGEADPELKNLLGGFTPEVYWTAGPHEMMANAVYAKNEKFYRLVTTIRYWGQWPSFRTDQGWKSRTTHLLNPRVGGTVFALHTCSLPFAYRVMPDHALAMGRSGFTRVGADEWAAVHFDGMAIAKWQTGMPVLFTLWPGPNGAQSGVRFEMLLEGIQETEARIFLEQALDRGGLPQAMAVKVRKVLSENLEETMFFEGNSIIHAFEQYHYRWQERSTRLYEAAAGVQKLTRK